MNKRHWLNMNRCISQNQEDWYDDLINDDFIPVNDREDLPTYDDSFDQARYEEHFISW
ncbi:MAG: hypothetical protein J6W16_06225 [Methanobrevibacter sp.]|nr:hypothetical protein [Methanobrevibacter sp.]